jgi:hypothetical protein
MAKNYGCLRPEGAERGFNIRRKVRNLQEPSFPLSMGILSTASV